MKARHTKPFDFGFLQKLGARIRHIRTFHRHLTQAELAERAHTSTSQISRIEYGIFYGLNVLSLKAIADALDTDVVDLAKFSMDIGAEEIELQRLLTRVTALEPHNKRIVANTLRGMLDGMSGRTAQSHQLKLVKKPLAN